MVKTIKVGFQFMCFNILSVGFLNLIDIGWLWYTYDLCVTSLTFYFVYDC